MALHATSWPLMDQTSMTAPSSDLGITDSSNGQRQPSSSHDQEWAKFLNSLSQNDQDVTINNNNIDLGLLALEDNTPTHFGAMDHMQQHTDPLPATSTNSVPPVLDSNSAPPQYMGWPNMSTPFSGYEQPSSQSTSWMSAPQQHHYDQPMHFMHGREGLGIQMAPTSHPVFSPGPMHYDQPFMSQESPLAYSDDYRQDAGAVWNHHEQSVPPHDDLFGDDDEVEAEDSGDPCYAQLLHRCLKEAPGHTMSLRELYAWVAQHSQKAKDPANRGWQNSVRHNLSMNAAFQRVPHSPNCGSKKGSLWRLTDDALRMGVISTTRYRKDPKRKSDRRSATPALNRQASGARGGRATRDATRLRQQHRNGGLPATNRFRRSERNQYSPYSMHSNSPSPGMPPTSPHGPSPYFIDLDVDEPSSFPLPLSADQTPPPHMHMMYDNQSKPVPQQSLEFSPLDYAQGDIFGDNDSAMMPQHQRQNALIPTPSQASYMTDTSYLGDENVPALMMCGSNSNSRENTSFQ